MAHFNSPFDADIKKGRIEGKGRYKFLDSGNFYVGDFDDGEFHGKGTIHFTHGGKYEAIWERGVAVSGTYTFKDGLGYQPSDWDYCVTGDRRFYSERCNGIQPAGSVQLTNSQSKPLPLGAYDVGDGYYLPSTDGLIHDYDTGKGIRYVNEEERRWILAKCRVSSASIPAPKKEVTVVRDHEGPIAV